jgi:hypothetical protein
MKGIFNNFKHDMHTVILRWLKERQRGNTIFSCKSAFMVILVSYACSDALLDQTYIQVDFGINSFYRRNIFAISFIRWYIDVYTLTPPNPEKKLIFVMWSRFGEKKQRIRVKDLINIEYKNAIFSIEVLNVKRTDNSISFFSLYFTYFPSMMENVVQWMPYQ